MSLRYLQSTNDHSSLYWQTNGDVVDPRDLPSLKIGVSSKLIATAGGDVKYQEFPDIIEEIIENASLDSACV